VSTIVRVAAANPAAAVTVTYASSVTLNANQGSVFRVVATGDLTLADVTGGRDGQRIALAVKASGADRILTAAGTTYTITSGTWWVADLIYNQTDNEWVLVDPTGGSSGTSPATTSGISDFVEGAQDVVGPMFTGGSHSGISFAYDDTGGRVNATVTGSGSGDTVAGQVSLADYGTTSTAGTGLNAAIAALPTTGGTITVPAGVWTIDTAVLISRSSVTIRGVGAGSSKLLFNGSTVTTAIKNADTTQRYVTITDLGIDATSSGVGTAIDASYLVNSQFHRLRIGISTPPNQGIIFNVVGTYYNTVRDCRIAVAGAGSRCLSFANIANSNWVDNCRLLGDANTVGVFVNAHANTIAHVDCETTMSVGIDIGATGHDCTVISPYLEQVDNGIRLASGVEAFTCLGGIIIDSDVANILDNGAKDPAFINTRLQYEPYTRFTARSPEFPQSYPIQTGMVQPADHGLISWSGDPTVQNTNSVVTAGTVYLTKVYARVPATLNNIYWWVGAAAVTPTAGQNEVGLYASSGALVVSANVDSVITSTGLKTTSVTATAIPAGWYWVAFVFNAATAPGLTRGNSGAGITTAMNIGQTASTLRYATNGTAQTVLPATITPSSNAATGFAGPWVAIG
jgi:hypothetical protein